MSEELKPCPFCGGEAKAVVYGYVNAPELKHKADVTCKGCSARVAVDGSFWIGDRPTGDDMRNRVIAAWNTRADVERLREALKLYDNALNEALAIIGGEYGDHYGPLADMVAAAQLAALGASSPVTPRGPIDWRDGPPPDELKDGRGILVQTARGSVWFVSWDLLVGDWWSGDCEFTDAEITRHCPVTP